MNFKPYFLLIFSLILVSCSASEEELIRSAKKELDNSKYEEAINHLNKAISINEKNPESLNMRGVAYFQQENYIQAINDFKSSISLDSMNYKPYYNKGNSHLNLKEFEKALIEYNKAIELLPNNADLYINRAIVLFELKQFEAAITDNDFAIKLAPGNYLPYLNKAKTLVQIGKFNEAEEILSPMAKNNIDLGEIYYWLAFVQINTDKAQLGCDNLIKAKNRGFEAAEEAIKKFCQKENL